MLNVVKCYDLTFILLQKATLRWMFTEKLTLCPAIDTLNYNTAAAAAWLSILFMSWGMEWWNDGLVRVSAVNTIFMWRSVNINIPGSGPAYVGHIGIHHAAASCWLRICSCHIIRVIFGMTIYIRSDLDVSRVERGHTHLVLCYLLPFWVQSLPVLCNISSGK